MTASPLPRRRNAVLVAALALIVAGLMVVATANVLGRLGSDLAPACRRLAPQLPRWAPPKAWRVVACTERAVR